MAIIPINPKDLPKELRARLKLTPKLVRGGLIVGAQRGKALLVRKTPVDLGQMKNSWRVRKDTKGGAVITNDAPHAGIIEKGARPHGVSKEGQAAIRAWVRRHFRIQVWSKPGRSGGSIATGTRMRSQKDKELDRITYLIVRKLQTEGQKPTYLVHDSMPQLERFAKAEVQRLIKKWEGRRAGGGGGTIP